jgi:hypothetical protein
MTWCNIRPTIGLYGSERAFYATIEVRECGTCVIRFDAGYVGIELSAKSPEEMLRYLRELAEAVEAEAKTAARKGGDDE